MPHSWPYVGMHQPPNVLDPGDEGPPLFSGYWTHMYSAAVHGTGSDTLLWVAGRAVGGTKCEWASSTCSNRVVPERGKLVKLAVRPVEIGATASAHR